METNGWSLIFHNSQSMLILLYSIRFLLLFLSVIQGPHAKFDTLHLCPKRHEMTLKYYSTIYHYLDVEKPFIQKVSLLLLSPPPGGSLK